MLFSRSRRLLISQSSIGGILLHAPLLFSLRAGGRGTSFNYVRDEEIYGEREDTNSSTSYLWSGANLKNHEGRTRQIGRFYLPGEFFGSNSASSITCLLRRSPTARFSFSSASDRAMAQRNMEAAREMWLMTADHLRHAEDHLLLLGRKTALERLAAFLIEMDMIMATAVCSSCRCRAVILRITLALPWRPSRVGSPSFKKSRR